MEQNTQSFMIEGANPSMVWCNIADYIGMLSKSMMKTYKQRQRTNKQITWDELDELNDKLRSDLDIIICGHKNVQNENKQRTNENRTMAKKQVIRLNENQLRKIVKESVKRVLNDENDIIKTFKHCHISKHPLKMNIWSLMTLLKIFHRFLEQNSNVKKLL